MQAPSRGRFGHYRDQDSPSRGGLGFYNRGRGRGEGRGRGRGGEGGEESGHGRGRGRGFGFHSRGRGFSRFGSSFKKSYNDDVRDHVEELFSKKFTFTDPHDQWRLPDPSLMFREEPSDHAPLLQLREKLNSSKRQLDSKEQSSWHKHTAFTNRAAGLVPMVRREYQPEMCTGAWLKLHEILWTFKAVPEAASKFNSVHLCEAPGAFVASLNHFVRTHRRDCEWAWRAMTLNPYHEANGAVAMIDQDRFMSETAAHWHLGADNTGDVMRWGNAMALRELTRIELEEVHLVTADGSVSCWDRPDDQEAMTAQLLFCEVVAALLVLKRSGTLVVKTFTTLEHPTVCLMFLLACSFRELHVFKPASSKAGNSEQYVIGMGYRGSEAISTKHFDKLRRAYGVEAPGLALFPLEAIPKSFLSQLQVCTGRFAKYQMDIIEENVRLYDCMRFSEKQFILECKDLTCETYKTRFNLKSLPRDKTVVSHIFLNGSHLNVVQPVQLEPHSRWIEHHSLPAFILKLERTRARLAGTGIPGEREDEEEEDDEEPAAKKRRIASLSDDCKEAIQHLLSSLGYEGGSAVVEQGVPESLPVAMEIAPEDIQWMRGPHKPINNQDLKTLEGLKVNKVTNSRFCRADALKQLTKTLESSQVMQPSHADEHDHVASHLTACHALLAAQPPHFLEPDALKFAALDHLIDFTAKDDNSQLLTFVDLSGAPSGYSHYIYWRKQHLAKGWGMVRIEAPKLGVNPHHAVDKLAPWETFQVLGPHTGVDILDNNSIKSLCAGVINYCSDGVQLVLGNVPSILFGGQQPGFTEYRTKQFLLSQVICALKVLKLGGVFVCQVYELLTRFSAGLVYVLYRLFEEVAIVKPLTSSPTSPERFLICKGYHGSRPIVAEMLLATSSRIAELREKDGGKADVLEILPIQLLFEEQFYRTLTLSNTQIARYQSHSVALLERHFLDPELLPDSETQGTLTKGLLAILCLPEKPSLPHTVI